MFFFILMTFLCFRRTSTNLEKFQYGITKYELYPENEDYVEGLLHDINTMKIIDISELGDFN